MALTKIDDRGLKTPIDLLDNEKIRLGTGNDLEIYHDGNTYIDNTNDSCDLRIQSNTIELKASSADEIFLKGVKDGAVELYYDNSKKFQTTSVGCGVTGNLTFADSGKAIFGAGDDLQIYHDGSGSAILNAAGSGQLTIASDNALNLASRTGTEYFFRAYTNGAAELYYDNSKKFETYANGCTVTGNLNAGNVDLGDSAKARFGASNDLEIYHDGSATSHVAEGTGNLRISVAGGSNQIQLTKGTAPTENIAKFIADGAVELYYDNSKMIETTSAGTSMPDGKFAKFGGSDDMSMGHNTNNYITYANADLLITGDASNQVKIMPKSDETAAVFKPNDCVELYYNNSKKLETASYGVNVISSGSSHGLYVSHSNGNEVARLAHNGSGDEGVLVLRDGGSATVLINGENGQNSHISGPNSFMLGTGGSGVGNSQRGIQMSAATSGNPVLIQTSSAHYTSGAYSHWYIYDDHGTVGSVNADGDGTASYNTSSDYRLKENVVPITDGITKLKTLKPYRFNFKTADASKVVQGFFAHEVSVAVPNAVKGTKDEMKSLYYEEGDTIPDGKAVGDFKEYSTTEINPQSLDHAKMVPMLTAALQEAIAKIEILETKVAALEAA